MKAEVTRAGTLDMQVCIPEDWTDDQIREFAEKENPCGTKNGWVIRRESDPHLNGCHERVTCESNFGYVHIVLDA